MEIVKAINSGNSTLLKELIQHNVDSHLNFFITEDKVNCIMLASTLGK